MNTVSNSDIKKIIHGKTDIQIGKNGLSESVMNQIKDQLKKNKFLKIRFLDLGEFNSTKEAAGVLCNNIKAKLIDKRGKTIVIQRTKRTLPDEQNDE